MLEDLAQRLRHQLPSRAPMDVAEHVQHCIVRLELLAQTMPSANDDDTQARALHALGESLLKTVSELFSRSG